MNNYPRRTDILIKCGFYAALLLMILSAALWKLHAQDINEEQAGFSKHYGNLQKFLSQEFQRFKVLKDQKEVDCLLPTAWTAKTNSMEQCIVRINGNYLKDLDCFVTNAVCARSSSFLTNRDRGNLSVTGFYLPKPKLVVSVSLGETMDATATTTLIILNLNAP